MKPDSGVESCSVIHVMAGALFDDQHRVLVAQRPAGKHMAGKWEFPGGKRATGESPIAALCRELKEELGVVVGHALPLIRYEHTYPDRIVLLDLWCVVEYSGIPQALEGQGLAWITVEKLGEIDLLEADRPMVEALRKHVGLAPSRPEDA